MDEPPSSLLQSRIPRTTILVDPNSDNWGSRICDLHCPLRKGIIYYCRDEAIFERNIYSSGKHEPRIIIPKHPSRNVSKIKFIPIKGNQILLFAMYYDHPRISRGDRYLHLSIHEIRSDICVGPALWSFNNNINERFNDVESGPINCTENALGIAFWEQFDQHLTLFDISTTDTDASDKLPLIESGRIDFVQKLPEQVRKTSRVILSPDGHILVDVDMGGWQRNGTIDVHYLDSGGTKNMNISFVARLSIPIPRSPENSKSRLEVLEFAFSADGSKFAVADGLGRVFVWDFRSKVPIKTFMQVHKPDHRFQRYLQFRSGKLGKEVLVFLERHFFSSSVIIHVIDATSFETEEILHLNFEKDTGIFSEHALFFDPNGGTLYAEHAGTLYEWDLRKNEPGPEWWIGEE